MGIFSAPTRVTRRDIIFSVFVSLAVCLFLPDKDLGALKGGWLLGLVVVLPFSFVGGTLSCWIYYGRHDLNSIDPFYIRACWSAYGGAIAWPICLLIRPAAANFAFITFTFGFGSVVAYHVYHRARRRKPTGHQAQRAEMSTVATTPMFSPTNFDHRFDVGTRIRFVKMLTLDRTSNHPQILLADAGEEGTITGYAFSECYWVKVDAMPKSFGAWTDEFEVVSSDAPQ